MRGKRLGFVSLLRAANGRLLPPPIRVLVRQWRSNRVHKKYARLSLQDVFDRIYQVNGWDPSSQLKSGAGSTGSHKQDYCVLLRELLSKYQVKSLADLGCGDFSVGSAIATMAASYIGVDIAQAIIDHNSRVYSTAQIHFERRDLTRDLLPPADAAVLRQVLQHLTNAEIQAALHNILATYPLVFITEHVYVGRKMRPNRDISHGPGTRILIRSGVFIDQPPFGVTTILVKDLHYAPNEVLRTWIVRGTA